MGGFFGAVSDRDVALDVFFGTDYHSHLGTRRGGMVLFDKKEGFQRQIHNIENTPFRTKFERDLADFRGHAGLGCISDSDPQPLLVRSHLGLYAIVTVGTDARDTALNARNTLIGLGVAALLLAAALSACASNCAMLEISPHAFCIGLVTACRNPVSSSCGVPVTVSGTMWFWASSFSPFDFGSVDTAICPFALRMTIVRSTPSVIIWLIAVKNITVII